MEPLNFERLSIGWNEAEIQTMFSISGQWNNFRISFCWKLDTCDIHNCLDLVDSGKRFPMIIWLLNETSMQPETSHFPGKELAEIQKMFLFWSILNYTLYYFLRSEKRGPHEASKDTEGGVTEQMKKHSSREY